MDTNKHTFAEVLAHFGTQEDMAKALGCARSAISQWRGVFPRLRAYQIEVVTAGRFKAKDLPTSNS